MRYVAWVGLGAWAMAAWPAGAGEAAPRKMSRAVLEDKVRGGWAGQMIGVAFGAPTEFKSNGKINEGELEVDARHDREHDPPGRPLRGDDLRRGHGPGRPRRHHRAVRRDVPRLEVQPVARERRGAAHPEPRDQGPDVRPPGLQRPRERHRLPDRVRLHRPHVPGAAAGLEPLRRPRRPGDELRRRPLRRHAVRGDVRRGLLRDRPAPGGRAGPAGDPGRERLRAAHPRRAGLARREPDGLAEDLAARSRRSGTGTTCARTGRSCPSTSTRASTGPTSCSASCTATATSRRRWRSPPARGRTPTATRRARPASWA